jgi:uncharacterized protein
MFAVNLRHVEERDIHLEGELPVAELDFAVQDELVRVGKPLHYWLQIQSLHESLLVTGALELTLDCECARCLKPFAYVVELPEWAVHLPLSGEEQVSVENDCVDLTPFIREDMLLEFPQHPLCRPDCAGLKKKSKVRLAAETKEKPSAWTELDKLKL